MTLLGRLRARIAGRGRSRRRSRRRDGIDAAQLHPPWRQFVTEALAARDRFDHAVESLAPGPLRDRLTELAERVHDGALDSWRIAQHGDALEGSLHSAEPLARVNQRLADAEQGLAAHPDDTASRQRVESVRAQLASARRARTVLDDTRERLRGLVASLDEAAARAVEAAATAGRRTEVEAASGDLGAVVDDLEALRRAFGETEAAARNHLI